MTLTGKVFKAYAAEIVAKHGFGSNKMVKASSPEFIDSEESRAQRLADSQTWGRDENGLEKAQEIFEGLKAAESWLIENGWMSEYVKLYRVNYGLTGRIRGKRFIGLTDKGWAVARKYLEA